MKKFFTFFCALLLLAGLGQTAHASPYRASAAAENCLLSSAEGAEGGYALCPTPDVWFYAAKNESSRLFLVPYTYYVKVISRGEPYTEVEYLTDDPPYQKVTGFCKTEDLLFVDFVPARPYLYREITLTYSRPSDAPLGSGSFDSMERTCVYYGFLYEGRNLYYYVLSDGVFDYVQMEEEPVFELNTDYLTSASGKEEPPQNDGFPVAGIVVIVLACAAAVVIAVFLFKGKKSPPPEEEF